MHVSYIVHHSLSKILMVTREIRWLIVQGLQKNQKHQIRIHQVRLKSLNFQLLSLKKKSYLFYNKWAINGEIQLESNDNNLSFFHLGGTLSIGSGNVVQNDYTPYLSSWKWHTELCQPCFSSLSLFLYIRQLWHFNQPWVQLTL